MIASGFFLWATNLSFRLFPLWVYDIFKIIHSYEAILAFLAIIIWHLYNVHLTPDVFPMSRVWLDGKISGPRIMDASPIGIRGTLKPGGGQVVSTETQGHSGEVDASEHRRKPGSQVWRLSYEVAQEGRQ